MLHKLSTVKSVIARFWTAKPPIVDEVELQSDLMGEVYAMNEEHLAELIAERDRLRKCHRRTAEIQKQIERVRLAQLAREVAI